MMDKNRITILLLTIWGLLGMQHANAKSLSWLLPQEAAGYGPQGEAEKFDYNSLFKLLNGGAEVYRALNVKEVISQRYHKEGASAIIVDVFDMGSAADAFGAYHHDMREGQDQPIGQEAEYMGGALYFWKGRYFVSIVALRNPELTKQAVLSLGRAIAEKIKQTGKPPALLALLPQAGRQKDQLLYFHSWPLLNLRYYLADDNILLLDNKAEGLLARYQDDTVLILVRYESRDLAQKAAKNFQKHYLPDKDKQGAIKTENNKWTVVRQVDQYWLGIFDANSKQQALELIKLEGKK
jgi:hypothetical protein